MTGGENWPQLLMARNGFCLRANNNEGEPEIRMRRVFQLLILVQLVSSCGTASTMPTDSRNPRTLEYLSLTAGSCLIGGDFGDDAVWNVSQCYGISDFHG